MKQKLYNEILNLALTACDDKEYKKLVLRIQQQKFNELRLFASEKVDYYNAIRNFTNASVIDTQLSCANRLEDIFTELYIGEIIPVSK